MRKGLGFISATGIYLVTAGSALADSFTISPGPGYAAAGSITLGNIPGFIITGLLAIGVVVALAFLIYGGIKWILSGGDKAAVDAARKHIVAAIIGLVIVVTAFVILSFVFQFLGITNPLNGTFCIPTLANGGKC